MISMSYYKPIFFFTTLLIVLQNCLIISWALSPEEVLDILNLNIKGSEEPIFTTKATTTPSPQKDSQAVLLGQLLRKFLSDNFRQLYYELYVINATLSELHLLSNMSTNINTITKIIPQMSEVQENVELIKGLLQPALREMKENVKTLRDEALAQITNISLAVQDMHLLKNFSETLEALKVKYFSDSKKHASSLLKLVQMTYSTAIRVDDMHQKSIRKRSCMDLLELGERSSGIYSIWPQLHGRENEDSTVEVYCDMELDGGGWTTFQRRGIHDMLNSQRPNFNRNWIEYEHGFGNATSGDYWMGLENIRSLTRHCPHELLINLTDWEHENRFAHYAKFYIGSKLDSYRLFVEGHSGNVDDSLLYHNKKQFSTFDEDNDDKWGDEENKSSCSKMYGGGWWFGDCLKSNLNGIYPEDGSKGRVEKLSGLRWNSWTPLKYSLKTTEMKIRPLTTNC